MASELDNLLGSRISLISQLDVRYDGTLFSINAKESSIVLKDVRCLGTEDRVSDRSKHVPTTNNILAYVTFVGTDIKDLYLHDVETTPAPPAPLPEPPKKEHVEYNKKQKERHAHAPPAPPAPVVKERQARGQQHVTETGTGTGSGTREKEGTERNVRKHDSNVASKQNSSHTSLHKSSDVKPESVAAPPVINTTTTAAATTTVASSRSGDKASSHIGTGEHLLHLRMRKGNADQNKPQNSNDIRGEFDFNAGLTSFNKAEVMATVGKGTTVEAAKAVHYKKDDFFDTLSCEVLDKEMGRRTHMTNAEERTLNQDTFGAVSLQSNYRGRGFRGRGRRSGGGGGGGGRGHGGRGRGRKPQQSSDT